MRIVTTGRPFVDIDAYACMVAYAELLTLQGQPAKAATSSKLNESIPERIRHFHAPIELAPRTEPGDTYTLVDISDPNHFDPIVDLERIDEIIDHHPGTEQYWRQYLGQLADIEFIGAASTLIYERWARAGLLNSMSQLSAVLLASGILDNTLNFGATITTSRDKEAYRDLQRIGRLPDDWPQTYFYDCQKGIESNLETAIRNDTKILEFKGQPNVYAVGQIVIWDAQSIITDHIDTIKRTASSIQPNWFMNVVSIKGDRSYFVCTDPTLQHWLEKLLGIKFAGNIAPANRLWLRKEIIQAALLRQ
jgi:inorganic pyrophosphatase/exopolyphosphatase